MQLENSCLYSVCLKDILWELNQKFWSAFLLLNLAVALAEAQTNYVALRRMVLDPQDLGIPSASITLDEKTWRGRSCL